MKKILCFIDSLTSGGAQRQMTGLAVLLQQKGYVVKIITYHDIPFYLSYIKDNDIDYEILSCGKGVFERLYVVGKAIKRYNPDVVISYLDTPNILTCVLKVCCKKWKLIVSERNTTQQMTKRRKIKYFLFRYADIIVPNSYSQEEFIATRFPGLKNKCYVINNFVDTDVFCPSTMKREGDMLRIIGVGRITKQKNISILIDAVYKVKEKGYNLRVDWYGGKFEDYENCTKLISQYNISDCFEFHEPYNPIIEKYHSSELFVLPSIYEGFPNVLCEALSCGLPAIASDVCDNGRIIIDGVNGFLFPSGDADKLADCIEHFMSLSHEQREKISEICRKLAVEQFSTEVFVMNYIKLIENNIQQVYKY